MSSSSSFFVEELPPKQIPQERYYSTHKQSYGQSAIGYINFKSKFPECFEDGLQYSVFNPLDKEEAEVNCIV